MKQFALENNIPVRFHGHGPNEPVNYCMVCEEEVSKMICMFLVLIIISLQVFNIFFVKEEQRKHVVHCLRCARQLSKDDFTNWICLGKMFFAFANNIDFLINFVLFFRGV